MENQIVLSMGSVLTILGGFALILGWFYKLLSGDIKELRSILTAFEKNAEHRFGKIETRLSVLENEMKNTNQRLLTIEGHLSPQKVVRFEKPHEEEPKEN